MAQNLLPFIQIAQQTMELLMYKWTVTKGAAHCPAMGLPQHLFGKAPGLPKHCCTRPRALPNIVVQGPGPSPTQPEQYVNFSLTADCCLGLWCCLSPGSLHWVSSSKRNERATPGENRSFCASNTESLLSFSSSNSIGRDSTIIGKDSVSGSMRKSYFILLPTYERTLF